MRPQRRLHVAGSGGLLLLLLAGCATTQPSGIEEFSQVAPGSAPYAPVPRPSATAIARRHPASPSPRPPGHPVARHPPAPVVYHVRRGDTVHSVARHYGLDYKDVVAWNNLPAPYVLYTGQTLRLTPGLAARSPTATLPHVAARHTGAAPGRKMRQERQELPGDADGAVAPEAPLAMEKKNAPAPRQETAPPVVERDGIAWEWPARGRIVTRFNDHSNAKGVDIVGQQGTPVYAAAAGKVVYSGSGLRGYGQLIIIKHSKTYLSAYAHNHRLLVKEGQGVKRGQAIAEMGSSDADQTELHFEIRRLGKPVDPLQFLPTDRAL